MIYWTDEKSKPHDITGAYYVDKAGRMHNLEEVRYGMLLVWALAAVASCFGGGYWRDDLPWVDGDIWRD